MRKARAFFPLSAAILLLTLVMAGCDREGRIPTAISTPSSDRGAAARSLGAGEEAIAARMRGRDHRHWPRRAVVAEAKEALGAVLSGEQVYLQRFGTFTNASDACDIRSRLGIDLSGPSRRWAFSVHDATLTGFVATARGLDDTRAERIVVTMHFVRGETPVWTVENARRTRS